MINVDVCLMHNSISIHCARDSVSGNNMLTLTATLPLKANDTVFVKNTNGGQIYSDSTIWGSFTGFKIADLVE